MAHSEKSITFAMDVLPNEDNVYNLGSSEKKWKIFGDVTGNIHWDNITNKPSILTAAATSSELGGIKVGYTTSGTNYKVQLDSNNNAYVSVPWSNTATATDNILDGSYSGTAITYAPYSGQQAKLSFDVSTTDPTRADRLNLNGNFHATNLYGDTAVIDNIVTLHYNSTDSALEFVFA